MLALASGCTFGASPGVPERESGLARRPMSAIYASREGDEGVSVSGEAARREF